MSDDVRIGWPKLVGQLHGVSIFVAEPAPEHMTTEAAVLEAKHRLAMDARTLRSVTLSPAQYADLRADIDSKGRGWVNEDCVTRSALMTSSRWLKGYGAAQAVDMSGWTMIEHNHVRAWARGETTLEEMPGVLQALAHDSLTGQETTKP